MTTNNQSLNKSISLAVASAFALSLGAASIHAAENPFAIKSLSSGYQVADATDGTKMKDGKCGTGKCGAHKKAMEKAKMEKEMADKDKEAAGSADMKKDTTEDKMADKAKDGSCSAEMKGKEGSCHTDKK